MWSIVSLWLVFSATVAIEATDKKIFTKKNEADLVRYVMTASYGKMVRPVNNPNSVLNLSVSMTPISINHVDEENQVLVLDTYIKMAWKDENLKWNPLYYQNITNLRLPSTDVWIPDLTLYTATPDSSLFPPTQTRVLVFNDGRVMWVPMFTIRSRCPIPRGSKEIVCNVKMGSWTYSERMLYIDLSSSGVPLDNFVNNNHDWKLKEAVASRESKLYPCCPEAFSALHFNFTLVKSDFDSPQGNQLHLG